jgi:hypothetical protein
MNGLTCGWQVDPQIPRSAFYALLGSMLGSLTAIGIGFGILAITGACGTDSSTNEFRACSALATLLGGPGSVVGYVWGYCLARRSRLQPNRGKMCLTGLVLHIARMQFGDVWPAAFTYDPDWTFDVAPRGPNANDLISRDALIIDCYELRVPNDTPTIHCEIPSYIGEAGCIGGSIGAAVGAAIGIAVIVALLPAALACGPLAFLCLLLIILLAAAIAYVGAELGAIIGHKVGEVLDTTQGLSSVYGEGLRGSCITVEGNWVTDQDHGHNEIHDVEIIPVLVAPPPGEVFGSQEACIEFCPSIVL